MENQTYTIGQTFKPGKNNRNNYLKSIKITDIKNNNYGTEYKLTFYMVSEMVDGTFKKSQRSTWTNSLGMYFEYEWLSNN